MASRCRSLWTRLLAGFSRHIGCHRCGCLAIWRSTEPKHLARALDAHRADCGCERWSLRGLFRRRVFDQELIIRVITSPDGYDTETKEILTRKLTALYSSGVSILRESSSEDEIRLTVSELTSGGAEPQSLVGAVVLTASQVRQLDPRQEAIAYMIRTHLEDVVTQTCLALFRFKARTRRGNASKKGGATPYAI